MEEGIDLLKLLKEKFACGKIDLKTYSPLTLAFVGDGVFDLIIRTVVVERRNMAPDKLHKQKSRLVQAETQAKMAAALQDVLTEEEAAVYRRGRNAKSVSTAKNASVNDYRKATGLEALYGYLYLDGKTDRIVELVQISLEKLGIAL